MRRSFVALIVLLGSTAGLMPTRTAAHASAPSPHGASPPLTIAGPHARQRTTWDSVFTDEQATRGQAAYSKTCARCHLESLAGGDESPPLVGGKFSGNWNGLTLTELHDRVRGSMPTDDPGSYSAQHVTDVIAYVLRVNGFPAGKTELTHEGGALNGIIFSASRP